MKRDLNLLNDRCFDVLIIGGGIYGATIACQMTRAGYETALIEQSDFSHATSASSLKILHGGLRYLQHLDFGRMRKSIKARKDLIHMAPHLVEPLACAVNTFGHGIRSKEIMRAAFFLNDIISWDRNRKLDLSCHIPIGKIFSRNEAAKRVPRLMQGNASGLAVWYDAIALNTERLTLEFVKKAWEQGACAANYVKAVEVLTKNNRVIGARTKDMFTGDEINIHSRAVVDATGPWSNKISGGLEQFCDTDRLRLAKAVNIVVKRNLFGNMAIGLEGHESCNDEKLIFSREKRFYFFVPWRGYTMIGTNYTSYNGDPDGFQVNREDICKLVDDVNDIYPSARLNWEDVTFFHAGLLPMKTSADNCRAAGSQLEKKTRVVDWSCRGLQGFFSVSGVKYTTAPATAIKVKKVISKYLGRRRQNLIPNGFVIPSSVKRGRFDSPFPLEQHLRTIYGSEYVFPLEYIKKDSCGTSIVSKDPLLIEAEIKYFIRDEMACKLSDIVFRRSHLGTAECPTLETLARVADIAGRELGWDETRKIQEIDEVQLRFRPLQKA